MPRNPNCNLCGLCNNVNTVCVWGDGPSPCNVMLIGRDPGEQEDIEGKPFVGASGKLLNEFLSAAGLQRSQVYVSNICKCVEGTSWVRLPGNKTKKIRDIVNEKYTGTVLSYDENLNKIVEKSIIGWYKTSLNNRKVYKVWYKGSKNNPKGNVGVCLTEDHPVLTQRGWILVKNLKKTDKIAAYEFPGKNAYQVTIGTLLGDGYINRNIAALEFTHAKRYEDYAKFKGQIIGAENIDKIVASNQTGAFPAIRVRTRAKRYLNDLRCHFYINGKKVVPRNIINDLTSFGLAVWIMDDGYVNLSSYNPKRSYSKFKVKGGNKRSLRLELCTNSFTLNDVKFLQKWFSKKDYPCTIEKRGPHGYIIRFYKNSTYKILKEVAKYFPPSMRYKLPPDIEKEIPFDSSVYNLEPERIFWAPVKIKEKMKPESKTVFCIDVQDTHNFLTLGGVVHNCRPPNNRNTFPNERAACRPYLLEEIKTVKPKFIITLGGDALEELTGQTQVMKLAGTAFDFKTDVFESKILITVHPAYITRNQSYKPQAIKHFETFGKIIRGESLNKNKSAVKYIYIKTFEQFTNFIEKLKQQKQAVVDLETTSLNFLTGEILCFSFSWKSNTAVILPLKDQKQYIWTDAQLVQIINKLKEVFSIPTIEWIGHNISFDAKFMKKTYDINIAGPIHDTMILHTLLDENFKEKGLKPLANLYTDLGKYDEELENFLVDLKAKKRAELFESKRTVKDEIKKLKKILKKAADKDAVDIRQKIVELEFKLEELEEIKIDISYEEIPSDILWKYSATDSDATIRLFNIFIKKLKEVSNSLVKPYGKSMTKLYSKLVMPLRKVLNVMEYRGALLDLPYLQELDKKYSIAENALENELLAMNEVKYTEKILYNKEADKVRKKYKKLKNPKISEEDYVIKHTVQPEFNINSTNHLVALLFETLKLPVIKQGKPNKKDGTVKPSTDKDVLEEYEDAHPCVTKLMANRKLQKLHKTYVKGMQNRVDINARIHTDFNQHVTVTGRLSSSSPNLQNIPRKDKDIKRAFITTPGWSILQMDYSQAEFRMWAQLSNDQDMIQDISSGLDIHKRTASEFWGIPEDQVTDEQRSAAKFVTFGLMYGRGAKSVAKQVGITPEEAQTIIEHFFNKYPVAARWLQATRQFATTRKYVINHFGRVRRLPNVSSSMKDEVAEAMRQAVNAPIQGGAADITGIALARIYREIANRNLRSRLILTVHDSIVLECPNEELVEVSILCHKCMTDQITGMIVPLGADIEVGPNWANVKKWNINKVEECYKNYIEEIENVKNTNAV